MDREVCAEVRIFQLRALHRWEKDWCADLQSPQMKILYFMHTSLKPMRSS